MKEAQLIKRFAQIEKSNTIGAGVFTNAVVFLNLSAIFNCIITDLYSSNWANDTVTFQGIDFHHYLRFETSYPLDSDNPALLTNNSVRTGIASSGQPSYIETYIYLPSGTQFTLRDTFYLKAVTANNILVESVVTIGYLCPKDYMSVDAFAVNPG